MRVCISGYYGSLNIGDELLLQATMRGIRRALGEDTEFCALGANAGRMEALHGIQSAPNTGWQSAAKLSNPPPCYSSAKELIRNSDLYVMGGGGLLGHDCVYTFNEVKFAKQHGIPVMALGVGGDPFSLKHRDLFQQYFSYVDAITVRDHWSYSNVSNVVDRSRIVLEECADPVFTLPVSTGDVRSQNRVLLVLSTLLRWGKEGSTEQDEKIRQWADTLCRVSKEVGVDLELYPFSPDCPWHDDRKPAEAFRRLSPYPVKTLRSEGIPFMEVSRQFSDCLAVVGDRYHSLILSALNGNPFLGIANDTKQRNVSTQLNQPWLYPENREGAHHIEASFRDLLHNLSRYRAYLLERVPEVRERAENNFKVLNRL